MQTYRSNPPSRNIPARREVEPCHREIHALVLRYIARTGVSESTFGRRAVNDPAFVSRLRAANYEMKERTAQRIRSFLAGEKTRA